MLKKTALHTKHQEAGAKLVDFAGWDMPLHYGSQLQEHHQVRQDAGMFDVSHMVVIDLAGDLCKAFLSYLLPNNIARLKTAGKALYSCMLNTQGKILDDLIVYFQDENTYRMVVNAATRDKDLAWIQQQAAPFGVQVTAREELAMIAVQGPNARAKTEPLLPHELIEPAKNLKVFHSCWNNDWFVARTGYTGEDGLEIILPGDQAPVFWQALLEAGVKPCGLGARDTLRLEAGMCLYGNDMDENTTPFESALDWTVAWEPEERDFIGRSALQEQHDRGAEKILVGLILTGKGVLRHGQKVHLEGMTESSGEITSGGFSPTLNASIALARVPADVAETVSVEMRGKQIPAKLQKPPFVRHGKPCIAKN